MREIIELASLRETLLFGRGLAAGLRPGDVVTLSGPIGSGKTTLARSIAAALTGRDEASSPSFTIWQPYRGAINVNHLDLYRIEDENEFPELGLHEAFLGDAVTLIEWPERAPSLVPKGALRLHLSGAGDEARLLEVE
jgi:tRNA threonylcarbamoyladenosine biosynthesis protein TsaE